MQETETYWLHHACIVLEAWWEQIVEPQVFHSTTDTLLPELWRLLKLNIRTCIVEANRLLNRLRVRLRKQQEVQESLAIYSAILFALDSHYEEALWSLEEVVLPTETDCGPFYNFCGQMQFGLKQWNKALKHFKQASQQDSSNEVYWYLQAQCFRALNAKSAAESALNVSLSTNPSFIPALLDRGDLASSMGLLDVAQAAYALILAKDPEHVEGLRGMAEMLMVEGQFLEARILWESRLKKLPHDTVALECLAVCLQNLAEHDLALECYSTCLTLEPNVLRRWIFRANYLELINGDEEALECLDTVFFLEGSKGSLSAELIQSKATTIDKIFAV